MPVLAVGVMPVSIAALTPENKAANKAKQTVEKGPSVGKDPVGEDADPPKYWR